jgi:hypothetical protein
MGTWPSTSLERSVGTYDVQFKNARHFDGTQELFHLTSFYPSFVPLGQEGETLLA